MFEKRTFLIPIYIFTVSSKIIVIKLHIGVDLILK